MKRLFFRNILILALCCTHSIHAQSIKNGEEAKPVPVAQDSTAIYDSLEVLQLREELKEAQLAEANMRMEMEQLRLHTVILDSLKHAAQLRRIDSLRQITKGVPVVVENDTLFTLFAKRGGHSPQNRAASISGIVLKLGKQFTVQPDSVYLESTDIATELMYGNKVIASVTDADALWENMSRNELARKWRAEIVSELYGLQKEHGLIQLLKQVGFFLLVIVVQLFLLKGTNWLYRKLRRKIMDLQRTHLKPFMIKDYELFDTSKQVRIFIFLGSIGRYLIILLQLVITVPILFSIFPQTESLAITLFSYLWNPIKQILVSIIKYIPNFFTVLIIYLAIRYVVKGIGYLALEIEKEKLKISGFYPDWAAPTYHIIRFLLYAFMIAMIYPYLPGSKSQVFQGVSVFVGLIISLGSSTVIGNIIAGLVITYMRPFKPGDNIKINETTGNVIEKTPLVTRIRTPKNEIVTIPNSFVMSSHSTNYSASAQEHKLILHTEVSVGYEVPWRKVHEILLKAAAQTPDVLPQPQPFIQEIELNDWYPIYQLNVYIENANVRPRIKSDLNRNIMDALHEADIEVLSPHYMAVRNGNQSTIPPRPEKKEGE